MGTEATGRRAAGDLGRGGAVTRAWREDETADLFRVSPATVRRWIKAGKLETVPAGTGTRITVASIKKLLEKSQSTRRAT